MLAPALPALPSLTSLHVRGGPLDDDEQPPPQLDLRPGSLRELSLKDCPVLAIICSVPGLGGVTKMEVIG